MILRLLGEASTIRNQIAQADTYLAGIERERRACRKEEEIAAAEIERLTRRQTAAFREHRRSGSSKFRAVASDRTADRRGAGGQAPAASELRQQIDQLRAECSRLRAQARIAREHPFASQLHDGIDARSCSPRSKTGARGQFKPEGVLADFIEVDPAWERAAEEFLHDELEYIVVKEWPQAEQSMDSAAQPNWKAARLSSWKADAGFAGAGHRRAIESAAPCRSREFHQRSFGPDAADLLPRLGAMLSG